MQKIIEIAFFLLFSQTITAQSFILKGEIIRKDRGYITLSYFSNQTKQYRTDTAITKNGKFEFVGLVEGAEFAQLNTYPNDTSGGKQNGIPFFIEPGIIKIAFEDGKVDKAIIRGSKAQKDYEDVLTKTKVERNKLKIMSASFNYISSQLENNLIDSKTAEEERKKIVSVYKPVYNTKREKELLYISNHPMSYTSLLLLYTYIGIISNDSIDLIYNRLSDKIKGSSLDNRFLAYNARYRKATSNEYPFDKILLNHDAPQFSIYSELTIDSITADTFKDKILLLEFWRLSCIPCLYANPYLEGIRKKYSDNLTIVSIIDADSSDLSALNSYIKKNKFTEWMHVTTNHTVNFRNGFFKKANFDKYIGLGVPRTILINQKGIVVYKNYGYSKEDINKLSLLIETLVKNNWP